MAPPKIVYSLKKRTMTVMSVDIGIRNFAVCIERFVLNDISKAKTIEETEMSGEILYLDVRNLGGNEQNGIRDRVTHTNLVNYLRSIPNMSEVDKVIIEQQMKVNPVAQKLEQATYTALILLYPHLMVTEYSPRIKTLAYGKKFKKKKDRKSWAIDNGRRILTLRTDENDEMLDMFEISRKKDDLGDVISMIQAFKWWTLKLGRL